MKDTTNTWGKKIWRIWKKTQANLVKRVRDLRF